MKIPRYRSRGTTWNSARSGRCTWSQSRHRLAKGSEKGPASGTILHLLRLSSKLATRLDARKTVYSCLKTLI
eukprot:2567170-Pyramimonas_sp.AAC.1